MVFPEGQKPQRQQLTKVLRLGADIVHLKLPNQRGYLTLHLIAIHEEEKNIQIYFSLLERERERQNKKNIDIFFFIRERERQKTMKKERQTREREREKKQTDLYGVHTSGRRQEYEKRH